MRSPKTRNIQQPKWLHLKREAPLVEVFRTVVVPTSGFWKKFFAFFGPGYLVAVGYMDPGNWATSLSGGAQFGYTLLFIAVLSNIMAIILQSLCARLAIATGRDLAQGCRDAFPKFISFPLWIFAELAICATDLAEVIGTAIGLNLLFKIPLEFGVLITALDVFLILWLQNKGFRWIEAFVISLLVVITTCFAIQIFYAKPEWAEVINGFIPTTDIITNPNKLFIALGIIGATVMPHNLYLHSGIVQTRAFGKTLPAKKEALKFITIDSTIALMFAFIINASILILAAATFHKTGQTNITELGKTHELLQPLLGIAIAPTLFGIALLCCGLNSTVTATMSGQIVMEGFLHIKLPAWLRRLITRLIAIVPAVIVILIYGADKTAFLLILSQVILSFQLPFAIIPLIMFTSSKQKMQKMVAPFWLTVIAIVIAAIIISLNIVLIRDTIQLS
jgi:manganese transport protein